MISVFSLAIHMTSLLLFQIPLRAEFFAIINCCRINYYETSFCDFGAKSRKFDPQNTVWMSQWQKQVQQYTVWKPIAKINFVFFLKIFIFSWVTISYVKELNKKYNRGIFIIWVFIIWVHYSISVFPSVTQFYDICLGIFCSRCFWLNNKNWSNANIFVAWFQFCVGFVVFLVISLWGFRRFKLSFPL